MSRKEKIDLFLSKWVSRKLMVLLIGTLGMFFSNIESSDWTILAIVYIGTQGSVEIAEKLFKSKYGTQT